MFDLNFLNFRSYVSALARGEELWCIWPAANRHWACAPMDHSENVFIRIKDMTPGVGHLPTPGLLTHVVSDSKSKHGGFYRKGPAVRRRLDRLPRTGQTCGGFLDFMHFFIAHQGTTIT